VTSGKRQGMNDTGYRKLILYQKAHKLVLAVYTATKKFPRDELFGLTSQMRRSAVSVVANIIEGYGRRTVNDKLQFHYIARGSLNELEYYIDLSLDLGYCSTTDHQTVSQLRDEVGKLLYRFMQSIAK